MKMILSFGLAGVVLLGALATPVLAKEPITTPKGFIYLINDYRYEPGNSGGDPSLGHALCGIRCNALGSDYLNYAMDTGMRLTRVEADATLKVDLKNPFMGGDCVCIVDKFLTQENDLLLSKPRR